MFRAPASTTSAHRSVEGRPSPAAQNAAAHELPHDREPPPHDSLDAPVPPERISPVGPIDASIHYTGDEEALPSPPRAAGTPAPSPAAGAAAPPLLPLQYARVLEDAAEHGRQLAAFHWNQQQQQRAQQAQMLHHMHAAHQANYAQHMHFLNYHHQLQTQMQMEQSAYHHVQQQQQQHEFHQPRHQQQQQQYLPAAAGGAWRGGGGGVPPHSSFHPFPSGPARKHKVKRGSRGGASGKTARAAAAAARRHSSKLLASSGVEEAQSGRLCRRVAVLDTFAASGAADNFTDDGDAAAAPVAAAAPPVTLRVPAAGRSYLETAAPPVTLRVPAAGRSYLETGSATPGAASVDSVSPERALPRDDDAVVAAIASRLKTMAVATESAAAGGPMAIIPPPPVRSTSSAGGAPVELADTAAEAQGRLAQHGTTAGVESPPRLSSFRHVIKLLIVEGDTDAAGLVHQKMKAAGYGEAAAAMDRDGWMSSTAVAAAMRRKRLSELFASGNRAGARTLFALLRDRGMLDEELINLMLEAMNPGQVAV